MIAIAAVVAIGPAAWAESRVDDARRAYDELRFGDVLPEIAAARRGPTLSRADDIELTRLEAYTYAVFEDAAHAVDAFRRLRALDPSFEPRDVSPKIRGYFDQARQPVDPPAPPIDHPPPPPERSRLRSPWVWGGAIAILGVAGAGVWLALRHDDPRTGNLGTLRLP